MFSSRAAWRGLWAAAVDGCAVALDAASAPSSSGRAKRSARSCLLYEGGKVSKQQRPNRQDNLNRKEKGLGARGGYRRFGLHDLGEPGVAGVLEMRCMRVWTGRRIECCSGRWRQRRSSSSACRHCSSCSGSRTSRTSSRRTGRGKGSNGRSPEAVEWRRRARRYGRGSCAGFWRGRWRVAHDE